MDSFSVSFVLGKASADHGGNVSHNNRDFFAENIDRNRSKQNVTYVEQNIREAYHMLFDEALSKYNSLQKQPCRRIQDYYEHVKQSKREEHFYEAIIQFGDSITAPCSSDRGEQAKQMLDEYMRSFQERNPNLHVFNAVLHMDEASPHIHLNFIPFYTKGRSKGLEKGVSLKAALVEQGFNPKGQRENQLVVWEQSEREHMEAILKKHGFTREDKNAKYAHMSVPEFKHFKSEERVRENLRQAQKAARANPTADTVRSMKIEMQAMQRRVEQLESEKHSPYKSFFYSNPDKQAYVQAKLDEIGIPYRETENGFEAQECFVLKIREIEKTFKAPNTTNRNTLRDDVDRYLMQSNTFEEMLAKLEKAGYEIKEGKYISVKPPFARQFIRLKSLGEQYSEYALKNRLLAKQSFESNLNHSIEIAKQKNTPNTIVLQTMQFYTITFAKGALPVRKRVEDEPFSWTNDSELDKLLALNSLINSGATLDSLKQDFKGLDEKAAKKQEALETAERNLKTFYELKEKIEIVYEGKKSEVYTLDQAKAMVQMYSNINASNYHNVDILIANGIKEVQKASEEFEAVQSELKKRSDALSIAEKVQGGTYVQSLVGEERLRRESDHIPNGYFKAGM